MDMKSIKEKAESDLLWEIAMARWFKVIELRIRYWTLWSMPVFESKKLVLGKIEKELMALKEGV